MPLTVDEFLEDHPDLTRLREELDLRLASGDLSKSGRGRRGDREYRGQVLRARRWRRPMRGETRVCERMRVTLLRFRKDW